MCPMGEIAGADFCSLGKHLMPEPQFSGTTGKAGRCAVAASLAGTILPFLRDLFFFSTWN